MKKPSSSKPRRAISEDMRAEYRLNYGKAKPNRFANRNKGERVVVILDPDIAEVFTTPESVNAALRALIAAVPATPKRKTVAK